METPSPWSTRFCPPSPVWCSDFLSYIGPHMTESKQFFQLGQMIALPTMKPIFQCIYDVARDATDYFGCDKPLFYRVSSFPLISSCNSNLSKCFRL